MIAEVVTDSPSLYAFDPEIIPVIDPSAFCLHLDKVGTPLGALEACCGAADASSSSSDFCPKLKKPKYNVAPELAVPRAFSTSFVC